MSSQVKEVFVFDKDNVFLLGLNQIVSDLPYVGSVAIASTWQEITSFPSLGGYDLYMIEVGRINTSGIALIEQIRQQRPDARILVHTCCCEEQLIERLDGLSVDGVVKRDADCNEMKRAIREMFEERYYCGLNADKMQRLFNRPIRKETNREDAPTKRELEVLAGIVGGNSSSEIARQLGISENTVESFRKKLILKLGAKNAVDMVVKAVKVGWISL